MSRYELKKILKKIGLLEPVIRIRRRFSPCRDSGYPSFATCSPNLLFAVSKGMQYAQDHGIAEGSDYYEFGICSGFTLWYAYQLAFERALKDVRFFGFDAFLGLPPSGSEKDKGDEFPVSRFFCPRGKVEEYLNAHGVDWEKVFLVDGEFKDTLNEKTASKYSLRKGFLFVVDCDLYESAKKALEFIGPLVQDRSVILFDDWGCFGNDPHKGEQEAFGEFLRSHPGIRTEAFAEFKLYGKGFILRTDKE